jgi:hypothetical protein
VKLKQMMGPVPAVDGAHFNTFTTLKDISPDAPPVLPLAYQENGVDVEIKAWGEFSTTGTPTLQLMLYILSTANPLIDTGAVTTGSGAAAWLWELYYKGRIRGNGVGASLKGYGWVNFPTSLTAATVTRLPATAALRTRAVDLSTPQKIGVGAAWGTSSVSNDVQCYGLDVTIGAGL